MIIISAQAIFNNNKLTDLSIMALNQPVKIRYISLNRRFFRQILCSNYTTFSKDVNRILLISIKILSVVF